MKKIEKARAAEEKKKRQEWAIEKRAMKERRKSHADHQNDLQKLINTIARLIDADLPCISCTYHGRMQGGHRISVGANSTIRFHLHNIHGQCYQCNVPKSGNPDGYDAGLIRIYGEEYQQLVRYQIGQENPHIKLSIPELIEKKEVVSNIIKELKMADRVYTMEERVELRNQFNERIGIYK